MKRQRLLLNVALLLFCPALFSQVFLITEPRLEFDGSRLTISYDLVNKDPSDIFHVWLEIKNQSGTRIRTSAVKGDIGDSITPGNDKKIIWTPEEDAIFLDEDITVELVGERYEKEFNKGSMMLLSTAVPGLGQTKISKGKPWWLAGVAAYGAVAGGLVMHSSYSKTYDLYVAETNAVERANLLDKSEKQLTMSAAMLISAAAIWTGNIVWVAVTPNKYRPLQYAKLAVVTAPGKNNGVALLSFRVNF
jgi:hypothetical protein